MIKLKYFDLFMCQTKFISNIINYLFHHFLIQNYLNFNYYLNYFIFNYHYFNPFLNFGFDFYNTFDSTYELNFNFMIKFN